MICIIVHNKDFLQLPWHHNNPVFSAPLTDLGRMSPPGHVLGPDGLLNAVHLLLVALAVAGGVLLGLLQSRLQGLDPLSRSTKTLFQFRKLTAQVCIITHQLWDDLHRLKWFLSSNLLQQCISGEAQGGKSTDKSSKDKKIARSKLI